MPGRCITAGVGLAALAATAGAQESQPATAPRLRIERELFLYGGERHSLAWSPDGKLLAVGGECGEVQIVPAESGNVRATLDASDHVQSLRFAPDGRHVAVDGRDLSLWTSAGKLVARAAAGGGGKLDWSPDGARIACMLDNSHVGLFRATDLGLAVRIDVPDDTCAGGIAFSPDGRRLAIGKLSATTYVLDLVAGRVVETLPGPADDDVLDVRYLQDGRLLRLFYRAPSEGLGGWEPPAGESCWSLDSDRGGGRLLLRTSKAVVLFSSGREPFRVEGSVPAALHPDGHRWARATKEGIEIWAGDRQERTLAVRNRLAPDEAVLTSDGRFLAVHGGSRPLVLLSARTGEPLDVPGLPEGTPLPYSAGPELALSTCTRTEDGVERHFELWRIDAREGAVSARRTRHVRLGDAVDEDEGRKPCREARIDTSGRYLALDGLVFDLLDPQKPRIDRSERSSAPLFSETLYPHGTGAVAALTGMGSCLGGGFGTVRTFDQDGTKVSSRSFDGCPISLDWSPAGGSLAMVVQVSHFGNKACVLDHRLAWRTVGDEHWSNVRWIDDETLVATSDEQGFLERRGRRRLVLANAKTGAELAALDLPASPRSLHVDRASGRVLVTLTDRFLVVR